MSNGKITDKGNMVEACQSPVPLAPGQYAEFHGLGGSSYTLYFKNVDPNQIGIIEVEAIRGGNIIFDETLSPQQSVVYNGTFETTGTVYIFNSSNAQFPGRPVITVSIRRQ